jgi:hypothetical protein
MKSKLLQPDVAGRFLKNPVCGPAVSYANPAGRITVLRNLSSLLACRLLPAVKSNGLRLKPLWTERNPFHGMVSFSRGATSDRPSIVKLSPLPKRANIPKLFLCGLGSA